MKQTIRNIFGFVLIGFAIYGVSSAIKTARASRSAIDLPSSPPSLPSVAIGRFQLIQMGQFRADQFLLDTATGRVWRNICAKSGKGIGNCAVTAWQPEIMLDQTDDPLAHR